VSDVDLFRISEDHEALREAVRAVVQDKVAPYAAAVDDESRFPRRPTTPCAPGTSTRRTSPSSTTASALTRWRPVW
jgi:alkylation response protein AidB-like acyl-CoA dehydrogenase